MLQNYFAAAIFEELGYSYIKGQNCPQYWREFSIKVHT